MRVRELMISPMTEQLLAPDEDGDPVEMNVFRRWGLDGGRR